MSESYNSSEQKYVTEYKWQEAGLIYHPATKRFNFYNSSDEKEKLMNEDKQEYKEYLASVDPVNHPKHYTSGKYEVIDIIEDQLSPEEFRGFLKGNIIKYICRAEHKNGLQDYQKAEFYSNRLVGK